MSISVLAAPTGTWLRLAVALFVVEVFLAVLAASAPLLLGRTGGGKRGVSGRRMPGTSVQVSTALVQRPPRDVAFACAMALVKAKRVERPIHACVLDCAARDASLAAELARSPHAEIREAAAFGAAAAGNVPLLCTLASDANERVRARAVLGLSCLSTKGSSAVTAKALSDPSDVVFAAACDGLSRRGDLAAARVLVSALEGTSARRVAALTTALSHLVDWPFEELVGIAYAGLSPGARAAALDALSVSRGRPGLADAILPLMDDPDKGIRARAVLAIAAAATAEPQDYRRGALQAALLRHHDGERSRGVRGAILEAVGRIGDASGGAWLLARFADTPDELRPRLQNALSLFELRRAGSPEAAT